MITATLARVRKIRRSLILCACLLAAAVPLWLGRLASAEAPARGPAIPPMERLAQPSRLAHTTPSTSTQVVYLPLVSRANLRGRQESLDLYVQQYLSSEGTPTNWTGDHATCNAGTTGQDFRAAVLRRINYFRTMAGLPAVTLRDEYNHKAQAAALMMSVNRRLSHSPTPDWLCYSSDGAQGAGSSDLYLGIFGWNAITGYMRDPGSGNYFVGHRRWILYPQTKEMGTGDIPVTQQYPAANALWVFDANMWGERPPTRDGFVAWPPPGYVPYPVVFARWSFSYPQADFTAATVTMTSGGTNVSVMMAPVVNGYGENTLVWIPLGLSDGDTWPKPQADTTYTVSVQNVVIGGQSRNFTYDVIIFDPTSSNQLTNQLTNQQTN